MMGDNLGGFAACHYAVAYGESALRAPWNEESLAAMTCMPGMSAVLTHLIGGANQHPSRRGVAPKNQSAQGVAVGGRSGPAGR